ncbi:hypothetical protein SMICM17S_13229 [Streptomyces microflavus]
MAQGGRQEGEEVGSLGAPEGAFPVDAPVVQLGVVLQLPAHQIAAVGHAHRQRAGGRALVAAGDHLAGRAGELGDPEVALGEGVAGGPAVAVEGGAGRALVGGGERVALGDRPVPEGPVVGVLLAHARRAGDDQAAVPAVGEADDELGVVVPAVVGVGGGGVGEVAVDLDTRDASWGGQPFRGESRPVGGVGVARGDGSRRGQLIEAGGLLAGRPRNLRRVDTGAVGGAGAVRGQGRGGGRGRRPGRQGGSGDGGGAEPSAVVSLRGAWHREDLLQVRGRSRWRSCSGPPGTP